MELGRAHSFRAKSFTIGKILQRKRDLNDISIRNVENIYIYHHGYYDKYNFGNNLNTFISIFVEKN